MRLQHCLPIFILLGPIISATATATQNEVINLQLRWHHQFQFAGYYAAVEKGFYQEEGLNVRLLAGDPEHLPVSEVLAGRAQYAEGNAEVLYQRLLGQPLVALAVIFQHSPSVLLSRQDSGIHSVHDLIGKKVMLMDKTADADFLTMFRNEGVSSAHLQIIPSSFNPDDLISGKVDAFNSYLTNEPYFLQQHRIPYNIISPANYRIDFYSDILFTTEAELNQHPKRVAALRRATLKGWRYAMDHPDEIIGLLINKYHVDKGKAHLEFEAAEMRKLIFPDLIEIGHMNPGRWQHMADSFVKSGLVKPDYSLDGFIYDTTPKHLPAWVKPVLVATFMVLAAMLFAAAYLYRINRQLAKAKDTLWQSEERLSLALGAAKQGWFDLQVQTGAITVSADYSKLLGYEPSEYQASLKEWQDNLHPEDREAALAAYDECLTKGGPISIEYRQRTKSGDWLWLNSIGEIIEWGGQHQALRMIGIHTDITERKQAEIRLQLAANVFSHAREGIFITDANGIIIEVNDIFTKITGYNREEALGQTPSILQSGIQTPEFYAAMWKALLGKGHWYGELWNRRKNGEVYAEMLTISTVRNPSGTPQNFVALFTDITVMKDHQHQLEHIAHYDALTNLPNRVLLADRLSHAMSQCERRDQSLAVAYLDLDGFKAVNDTHGHEVGDELLIAISQRMKDALREGDTLARIGGDEFVAVLVDLEERVGFEAILTRLLEAAAEPVSLGNNTLQVSASIGITLYPQDGADADKLIRHADQAMYIAKQTGKNRYHLFDIHLDSAVNTHRESLEHIRAAIGQQEFELYYQPKVNMKSGAVIGAEALIRWRHPERGLLLPAVFLPIIENHPISVELGEWVINTALAQMAAWHSIGLNIAVSVNVGAHQLQQPDFVAQLSALLARHPNVQPGNLVLEILETSALADMAEVSMVMNACCNMGVRFVLDDFGTGYSSLTYLRRLPAEMLKIDQSFIRDMLDDPDDLAIVIGVISLAAAFRRQVIAEGIETVSHGTQLLAMGCELAQGFCIAEPMPAADIPNWVATWKPDPAWTP